MLGTQILTTAHQVFVDANTPLDTQLSVFQSAAVFEPEIAEQSVTINRVICDYCDPPDPTPTPTPIPPPTPTPTPTPPPPGVDQDIDGFSDSFETELADGFTPYYHVSGGEMAGTGFATFNDSVPETVKQSFPAVPPISHYRVTPLRFAIGSDGLQYGLIQIDYLTLWNRDDGLEIGPVCSYGLEIGLDLAGLGGGTALSNFLDGARSHMLDNERTALLVAAPVVEANSFNSNPSAYRAFSAFLAAHENTYFDKSVLLNFNVPFPWGLHPQFFFSRSKHGTYRRSIDFLPLMPLPIIVSAYINLDFYLFIGKIEYYEYLVYMYLLDNVFFTCVVEHFQEQGGVFAGNRINVGELTHPINGSGFILDPSLVNKLNRHF